MSFDPSAVRPAFPALSQTVNGRPLVYLDNAATQQIPLPVLQAVYDCESARGNVHRGAHALSERSTCRYENARAAVAEFLNVRPEQIIFTAGTTDSIHLAARSLAARISPGDEIAVTRLEHHSNFLPWQQLCRERGAVLRIAPLTPDGTLDLSALDALLGAKTRLLAVTQCSNVLGCIPPLDDIIALAHKKGVPVLVDGAQGVCHLPCDLSLLDCDYYAFSGHKLGGPVGIGVLYAKAPMTPARFGGGMVRRVTDTSAAWAAPPHSMEAGTPNVAGAVGLAAAIDFRRGLPEGWQTHEAALLDSARTRLSALPGLSFPGNENAPHAGCLCFSIEGVHSFDAAALLDQLGIALRAGQHCAQPLLDALGLPSVLRVSPCFYNTFAEIDALADGLTRILPLLRR